MSGPGFDPRHCSLYVSQDITQLSSSVIRLLYSTLVRHSTSYSGPRVLVP